VTDTRAIIQWESDVNSTGKVLYGTAANALTQEAETDGQGRLHTVRLSGLTLGTRYFYQVTNSDTRGTSNPFPPLPAQFFTRNFPDTQPPRILRGPVAYGITNNRADIVLDTDEAAVVDIQYGTAENDLSLTVSRASTQLSHSLVLEALTPATQYFYRAKLTDLIGNATTTGTKAFRTRSGADNLPPRILGRPAVLSRSFNATVIQWFTDEASNSTVLYGTSATTLTDSTAVDEAVRDHKVSLGNLGAGTEYFFQVKSADASGNVAISPVSPFITNSSEDTQAPIFVRQPGVVRSSNTEAVIVFETNEPTTAAVQYATTTDVYADDTGSVGETVNATDVSRNHKITLTNLTPTTRYHFKVSITDLANNGPTVNPGQRNFATRTLADTKAPVVFSRPVAQGITSSGAIIRWGADEPHSAVIRFGKITAGSPVTSADLSESIEDINVSQRHAVALADLTAGTTYAYEVETTDDAGNASKSVNLRFSTPSGVDTAPPVIVRGPVVRNITSTGATIEWLTNEISDSRVSVGTTTEYTSVVEESDGTREHSLTLTGLDAGTVYHYAVGSADQSGNVVTTDAVGTQIGLSKDHIFRTLATDDTLAPVITEGPIVEFTNELAVVKWRTDELSTSRVTIGLPSGSANIVAGSPVFGQTSELVFEDNDLVIYHSVTVTQLSAGSGYIYQASSTDASGNTVNTSTPSGASTKLQPPGGFGSFTTSTQADSQFPVITSGPTVVASTSSSMTIEWGTDESANSRVAFGISADSLGTQEISGTNLTTHRVVLTKLAAGTTYAYEVASTDASGNGETLSKVAYGTTPSTEDLTAPVITTGPTVIYKNDRSATLQWVTNEAANAEVAFGTLADSLINVRNLPDFETEHTVTLTNLSASTTYYYKASSTDQNNNGPATSSTLNFTTESAPDTQVPVVSEVSASAADSTAIVTWKSDEVSDSSVRYGTASGTYDFNSGDATDVTSHTVTLTNLKPNTPYFYIVESIDRSGNGPTQSSEGTFTTASTGDVQAPAAPTGLLVTGGNNAVKLFWSASASAGVVGYLIERAVGGGAYAGLASIDPGTSYVDNNVTNGTSYSYRIASVGLKQLTSSASTASEAVTPAAGGGPSAPKLFALQGSQLTPTLAITNSTPLNASDVLNYTFHLASSADFSDAVALEAGLSSGAGTGTGDPSGVTAFTVSRTLTDGTTYYYRVKSSDGTFDSAYLTGSFKADAKAPQYPGDITGDRSVGFPDFLAFLGTFNKKEGQDGYLSDADLSGDGAIGFPDFLAFLGVFNKKYIKGPSSGKPIVEIAYGEDTEAQFQLVGRPVSLDEGGQEIAVDIQLSNASDLMGYGVRVTYDPANAQFISATDKGETLLTTDDRRAEIFGTLEHDAEKGEVFVAGAITSGIPVEGQGILATLHFRLLGSDPQKALIEIAQGLLIDGGLNANVAIHLGDRFALLPGEYALDHNFPNPFNPETTLKYALPKAGEVTLIVYNVLGQEIVRLVDAKQTPGYYTIRWNGQDALGHSVASGVYLYRIQAGDFNKTHKMLLLK
jgi:phosphodiesterase/alkaline phosphatase D-like protein